MQVIRAKTAGTCWGVDLALRKLSQSIEDKKKSKTRLVMFGLIIHNPQVIEEYKKQGVTCVHSIEEIQPGDTVIVRAHGIPTYEEEQLRTLRVELVDATCPKVKKTQLAIANTTNPETILLLFGEAEHPEVKGLISYSQGLCYVFDTKQFIEKFDNPHNKTIVLASQTTQDELTFKKIQEILLQKGIQPVILNTICDATYKRQRELLSITEQVDAMVVVGGFTSGNTRRLVELAKSKRIKTLHIETVDALYENSKLDKNDVIGLTGGASTPKPFIDKVETFLNNSL